MIAYIDSSVILRRVLGQPDALAEWSAITRGVTSELSEVECLRTLDRLRFAARGISDADIATRRAAVFRVLEALEIVELTRPVLSRASLPAPTALGTLDAIHLATAQLWREWRNETLVFATHDRALAIAAEAEGLLVVGSAGARG